MGLPSEYLAKVCDDDESRAALLWLNDQAKPYPSDVPLLPLRRSEGTAKPRKLATLALKLGGFGSIGEQRVAFAAVYDGRALLTCNGDAPEDYARWFSRCVLTQAMRGALVTCDGGAHGAFDVLVAHIGPELLKLGYTISPILREGRIGWLRLRKSKHSWTLTDPEVMTGEPVSTLLAFAQAANVGAGGETHPAAILLRAIGAWQGYLMGTFGVALAPTVSTVAYQCARRFLPAGEWKWPCPPLLVAFERDGYGYRGGLQVAQSYRGPAHRVDINRQYAGALAGSLPLATAFTKWRDNGHPTDGVWLCHVRLDLPYKYPLGVWDNRRRSFAYRSTAKGRAVCILHGAELDALARAGAEIRPICGFAYTRTFTLAGYVAKLQGILTEYGREHPIAKLTKPLGNMVYGKFGQRPDMTELLFSLSDPGEEWAPYVDIDGTDYVSLWERSITRYTANQHPDIAGEVTSRGRAQIANIASWLSSCGVSTVRIHTDSLTTVDDPRAVLATSDSEIGWPRYEGYDAGTIVATANGILWRGRPGLSGVSGPTVRQIEDLYEHGRVYVTQKVHTLPWRVGLGVDEVQREYVSARALP